MARRSYEWVSPIGGNWAYWAKNAKLVGEFIKANAIAAATIGPVAGRKEVAAEYLIDLGIKGGIRVAHLHFKDQIYLLNDEQWAKFSAGIIANAKTRLAKVNTVSFEEGMVLGSIA
jgi:hypothetical protein